MGVLEQKEEANGPPWAGPKLLSVQRRLAALSLPRPPRPCSTHGGGLWWAMAQQEGRVGEG